MEAASVSIRLNPFKGLDGPEGAPVPWSPYGRILPERPVFTTDPRFHAGCYYVQDSSAMYVGHIFRKLVSSEGKPGIRVLDLCAAPGGKTTDLAASLREMFGDRFTLVSNEVMKARLGILRDNVSVWGDPNVIVTGLDPSAFARMAGWFDVIVADVPCSGEGMFRKDARAEAEWSPAVVDLCAARQKRIVADVWPALREGGILVYSTCTYEDAENDDNLKWAAEELGGGIIAPENEFASSGVRQTAFGNLLKVGEVPGEGQWVGALRKTSPSGGKKCDTSLLRRDVPTETPDPDIPLRIDYDRASCPEVALDLPTALKYLHRDALVLPGAERGLNVVTYNGHPLGYVKNIGSRCNNLYPKSRRILMNV